MRAARLFLAFAAGVWLYQIALILVGGILAAAGVPKAYFEWFGRSNTELALAVLQLFGFALPVTILVAGGTLATQRILAPSCKAILLAILGGLLSCFSFWLAVSVFPADLLAGAHPPSVLLRQILLPPWWALSGLLAPWLGYVIAAWLLARRAPA